MQLQARKGETKGLPGETFTAGLGWDKAPSATEEVDLDLWLIRTNNGKAEAICWANEEWHRPDLGANSEGNPWIATPELDVVHKGDDRTGEVSATGYDETVALDLGKAPASVTQYSVFATYYDDPDKPTGHTLGMASNVTFGCTQESTGNEVVSKLEADHAFDVTVLLCTIDRDPADPTKWSMTSVQEGYTDTMFAIAEKLGVA